MMPWTESRLTNARAVRRVATGALLAVLLPSAALAGTIFGTLTAGGKSVGRAVEVQVTCGGDKPFTTATDDYGAYTVNVPRPGRCDLMVFYQGRFTAPYPVASSDDPARYDFELVFENNQYILKRR